VIDGPKLDVLRIAVLAGEESGVADGDVKSEVRERIRRRALVTRAEETSADSPPPKSQLFEES
jgi:hypothetical protein